MHRRGNQRPSALGKVIFVLIVMLTAAIIWISFRGISKQPDGAPAGSQVLPGQVAKGLDQSTKPAAYPTPAK